MPGSGETQGGDEASDLQDGENTQVRDIPEPVSAETSDSETDVPTIRNRQI